MACPAKTRRTFRWPGAARELVQVQLANPQARPNAHDMKLLVTKLVEISGNPRKACWRFLRQAGLTSKRNYRPWTKAEQQRLLDLMALHTLSEVTVLLRRSATSIRAMLHRLGASACMGEDWFTKHALSEALHVRSEQVQQWIDRGWLKSRIVPTGGLKREVIDADDFCQFCKQHRSEIVGRRLNLERLSFVQTFVFPPSHMELLAVREAKKEQAAYDRQLRKEVAAAPDDDAQSAG
jgi:radical SAM superfamily enzyme with C-terminal helix-hairpin-helix motif